MKSFRFSGSDGILSGNTSPPPQRGRPSQSRFACQLSQGESQGSCTPFLPPAFMRGRATQWQGEFPAAAGKASSVTASPCQLPQRGSQGSCAPITGHSKPVLLSGVGISRMNGTAERQALPPAFMRGEGHAVAGGVLRAAGKASSVTASPCQLPQRGSRGRFAPILNFRLWL